MVGVALTPDDILSDEHMLAVWIWILSLSTVLILFIFIYHTTLATSQASHFHKFQTFLVYDHLYFL